MPALREIQRQFAAWMLLEEESAICSHVFADDFSAAERLRIYRNTFRSTLTETLRMTYPAVDRLVGRDCFDAAADGFIRLTPPSNAYLNAYGGAFPEFLATVQPTCSLAYLFDVARFEWALSVAANAIDAPVLKAKALAAVDPAHHIRLCFEAHPSVRFLTVAYPADEIADAVMSGDETAMAEIDLSSGPVRLVVHRGPDGVESQRLEAAAYDFVSRLCAGEPLGRMLEQAPAETAALIADQLTRGRLTAFHFEQSVFT